MKNNLKNQNLFIYANVIPQNQTSECQFQRGISRRTLRDIAS
ncbi:hypothetical protein HanIR_Chr02g0061761 [Helianthus annuus]|nr:hypothetical protein HanIR_Chr02g0061761 [Helianthus annuus]